MSFDPFAALLSPAGAVIALPLVSAVVLAGLRGRVVAGWLNFAASVGIFLLSCLLPWRQRADWWLWVDPLAAHMAILTSFVVMLAAWSCLCLSAGDRPHEPGARPPGALLQALAAALLLALLANDPRLTWLAITGALVVVMASGGARGEAEARWNHLVLAGGAIGLLALGTAALLAAPAAPGGAMALAATRWSALPAAAAAA